MNDSCPVKPKRRWYQFSLRALLVFVLVAGTGLGWLGRWLLEPPRYRMVLFELVDFHPDINFDADGRAVALWNFRASNRLGDYALRNIEELTRLQRLDLSGTQVTDAGLQHLSGLTVLEELTLRETQVTDEGVKNLQQALPNCKIIH